MTFIKPKISICISTYNRIEKLLPLVKSILLSECDQIEVIVSDNHSTDNTYKELMLIDDKRLKYYKNINNIGAVSNYLKAMSLGCGEIIFFCTDKDYIKSDGIQKFISFLNTNTDIVAGVCNLNIQGKEFFSVYNKGLESLENLAYLSKHPTGYFFKNDFLKKLNIIENYSSYDKVRPFPFEFIMADLSMIGKTAIVNYPICDIEKLEDVERIQSYSYSISNKKLFFSPNQRYLMLEKYISHAATLNLDKYEFHRVLQISFRRALGDVAITYKNYLSNSIICHHYMIKKRQVSIFENLFLIITFCLRFIFRFRYSNVFKRSLIIVKVFEEVLIKNICKVIEK